MGPEIFAIVMAGIVVAILLAPIIHVLASDRSHGGAKFGWFLAVFLFSWLAYIAFLIVTQQAVDQKKLEKNTESIT